MIKSKDYETIGLCHGCFDLFHYGHLLHFQEAKKNCDYLIVSITSDSFLNKECGRPIFTAIERKAIIESIKPVDKAIISNSFTGLEVLKEIKPSIFFKGIDYSSSQDTRYISEVEFCKKINCKIHITKSPKLSTTYFIKKCKDVIF